MLLWVGTTRMGLAHLSNGLIVERICMYKEHAWGAEGGWDGAGGGLERMVVWLAVGPEEGPSPPPPPPPPPPPHPPSASRLSRLPRAVSDALVWGGVDAY